MGRFLRPGLAAGMALGFWTTIALSQPCADTDIAFDPAEGTSLERVNLSASLANTGDEGGLVSVAVTVEFNGESFGPLEASIYLLAGKELGGEVPFLVRPVFPSGTLAITVDVAMGECTDTATASLEIVADNPVPPQDLDLASAAISVLQAFGLQPTPVQPTSWGAIKTLYQ